MKFCNYNYCMKLILIVVNHPNKTREWVLKGSTLIGMCYIYVFLFKMAISEGKGKP